MKDSVYHSLLRISALTLSLVLLFVSGVLSPVTKQLSISTTRYLAQSIGMSASVEPNQYNTLSAQIAQKQKELDQREIAINLKEAATTNKGIDVTTFVLSVLLFILLVLIILNYALDYLRARKKVSVAT